MNRNTLSSMLLLANLARILAEYRNQGKEFTDEDILKKLRETSDLNQQPSIYIGPTYTIYDYLEELEWEGILEKIGSHKYKFKERSKA